ncbi:hypothetical protein BDR05DRAFT_967818 [Suillus weaverae]|nr:hypothetical protein BDR05DRAFT_967818 [Suillus weaverae]
MTTKDHRICICDTPPDVIVQACDSNSRKTRVLSDLLNSDATRGPVAGHRKPPIPVIPMVHRSPPAIHPQQRMFLRLSRLLCFSPHTSPPHHDRPRDPLDNDLTMQSPCRLVLQKIAALGPNSCSYT